MNNIKNTIKSIPTIALRGLVAFPDTSMNIEIGRKMSINALNSCEEADSLIFLVPQIDPAIVNPKASDLAEFGVIAKIQSIVKISSDNYKLLISSEYRGKIEKAYIENDMFLADVIKIEETTVEEVYLEAGKRTLKKQFNQYAAFDRQIPAELIVSLFAENDLQKIINVMSSTILKNNVDRIEMISILETEDRMNHLMSIIEREIEISQVEKEIGARVKESVDKSQKEYYLREQMKAISHELGDTVDECNEYREKIAKLKIKNKEITNKIEKEINRLEKLASGSPDTGVIRNYLDWIIDLPWNKSTKENIDIAKVKEILDEDHYGLEKVKERILEFISVYSLTKSLAGPILCLVGPPGVGKTSIAKSIARAINRNYVRMSLGGVRDEAEIRGHRKTYIGAMPGRIISNMKTVGSMNPLFLLDEIDKMSSDFRGDPSSAMLEVLDPEINSTFRDNFLEIPFDLSKVFFMTTANSLETIPDPLYDRMEVIELSGYTEEEKIEIAKKYLVPKKAVQSGLAKLGVTFTDKAISDLINFYTRESGVRGLEREISNTFRKIAMKYSLDNSYLKDGLNIDSNIEDFLGVRKFTREDNNLKSEVGACMGLAWTSVGGTTLTIEVSLMKGKGEIILTGKLGEVMRESARTALSYIHSNSEKYSIDEKMFTQNDIHIHVPEGATPKDGPSAGITMATAILSALTNKPVTNQIAMTGEITLRGNVLPIGGLKEKALAAYRIGIKHLIIPKANEKDLTEIPMEIKNKIKFTIVDKIDQVFKMAIEG